MSVPVRVLVVDDEPQILRALRATLRGHGYDVHTVGDGEEALDEIATHPPDIVILDLVMPGKSGFEVVREVRQWSSLPIIVLSARGGERDKVTALDLGADDYLTKPFGADELLARLRVALRHRGGTATTPVVTAANSDVAIDLARRVVTRAGEQFPGQLAGLLAGLLGMVMGSLGPQALKNQQGIHHRLAGVA